MDEPYYRGGPNHHHPTYPKSSCCDKLRGSFGTIGQGNVISNVSASEWVEGGVGRQRGGESGGGERVGRVGGGETHQRVDKG